MHKLTLALSTFCFCLLVPTYVTSQSITSSLSDLLDITQESTVGNYGFYGSTATIQFGDGTRWSGATGVTGPATASKGGRALTVDDRFHIGSQTKTFTGTVVLKYVDSGIVSLDDTLQDWFVLQPTVTSALSVMPQSLRETITVRNLLSMRTGLAEYLGGPDPNNSGQTVLDVWNAKNGNYDLTREQLLAASLALPATMVPGDESTFEYSNANFMLAGIIAEAASCEAGNCRDIGTLITDEVIVPLNLDNTLYPTGTEWGTQQHTNGTWNYYGVLSDFTETTPSVPNSAGAMISNVQDQLDWLVELTTNAKGTLDPDTFAERLQNTQKINGAVGTVEGGYGLGIYGQYSTETGAYMLGHGGELSGYQTLMFYFPGDPTNSLDDLFIVADLNTFLNFPGERTFLPSDINNIYYELQKTVALYRLYVTNPDGCVTTEAGTTCTATTLSDKTLAVGNSLTIQPSGKSWVAADGSVDSPVPTYVFYGNNGTAVTATDATITVEEDGIIEGYGNGMTLLQLGATANSVLIAGELSAIGANAVALDASAASNDTILVTPTGNVTGNILATRGSDTLWVEGEVLGDVILGTDATLTGSGVVKGMASGAGTFAPGTPGAANASSMTVSRFEPTGGTLEIQVFGSSRDANRLLVKEQTSEDIPVVDTGIATLNNSTLRLTGTPLTGDIQVPILTATNGLTGTFTAVSDTTGLLTMDRGRLRSDLFYTDNKVFLTSTSPAVFDAVAAGTYSGSLIVLDQAQEQLQAMAGNRPSAPFGFARAIGSHASYDGQDYVAGFDLSTGGWAAGMGGPMGSNGYFALTIAQTDTAAEIRDGGATQDINALSAGVSFGFGFRGLDVSAAAFFGEGDIDYRRETGSGTTKGSTDQQLWNAIIGAGQTLAHDSDWQTSWRSSLAYSHVNEDGFSETTSPGVAMDFDKRSYNRLRLGLGVKSERKLQALALSPWVSADLLYHADLNSSDTRYTGPGNEGTLSSRSADGLEVQFGAGAKYTTRSGAIWSAGIIASDGDLAKTARMNISLISKF